MFKTPIVQREKRKEYYLKNKESERKNHKNFYNSEEGNKYYKNYYKKNKDKLLKQNKIYRSINKSRINKQKTEYLKKRYNSNKEYNLICRVRRQFYNRIKNKHHINRERYSFGIDWNEVINSFGELPKDIENYHIDHIIPLNSFNFYHEDDSINETEMKKAWCPLNLRLIKSSDNLKKGKELNLEKYPLCLDF